MEGLQRKCVPETGRHRGPSRGPSYSQFCLIKGSHVQQSITYVLLWFILNQKDSDGLVALVSILNA